MDTYKKIMVCTIILSNTAVLDAGQKPSSDARKINTPNLDRLRAYFSRSNTHVYPITGSKRSTCEQPYMGIELHDPGNTPPSTFISDVAAQQDPTDIESIEDDSLLIMSTAIDADTQNHAPRHRALSNHHVLSANSLPIPDLWPDWYFENPETYREQEERLAAEAAEQNDDLSTDDE